MAGHSQAQRATTSSSGKSVNDTASMAPARPLTQLATALQAGPGMEKLLSMQAQLAPTTQRMPNRTGLPDSLKQGVEALSGLSMDDVRVHRNSTAPAQMQAQAFARGTDIHLAPGQEQHLPHEAWHVAQQKQGRVAATVQAFGHNLNTDPALEQEADLMGERAVAQTAGQPSPRTAPIPGNNEITQGKFLHDEKTEYTEDDYERLYHQLREKNTSEERIAELMGMANDEDNFYMVKVTRSGAITNEVQEKEEKTGSGIPFAFRYNHAEDAPETMDMGIERGGILARPSNKKTYENVISEFRNPLLQNIHNIHKTQILHPEKYQYDDEESENENVFFEDDADESNMGMEIEDEGTSSDLDEADQQQEEDLSPNILRSSLIAKSVRGNLPADRKRAIQQTKIMGISPVVAAASLGLPNATKGNWEWLHMVAFSIKITHSSELSDKSRLSIQRTAQPQQIRENLALGTAASNTEMLSWETAIKRVMAKYKGITLQLIAMPLIEIHHVDTIAVPVCHFLRYHFNFEYQDHDHQIISAPVMVDFDTQTHTKPSAASFKKVSDAVNLAVASLLEAMAKLGKSDLNPEPGHPNLSPAIIDLNKKEKAEGIRTEHTAPLGK